MKLGRLADRRTGFVLVAALFAMLMVALDTGTPAGAANAAEFDAGNIISDAVFFNSSTMSSAQVQQFLSSQGSRCAPGEQPCLKDYRTVTVAKSAEVGLCQGYAGGRDQSAAEIITGVAQSCGINPRVLIVLLEKENSLVTRTNPTNRNYQAAAGYGCPDSAACNAQYYGFFNQLYMAARQYQRYAANPTSYGHVAGRINNIAWNPNASCGTSQVYIANQATAGLYNYTPYRPNAAALNNLYGTGDSCSSYGNRNFWRLFTDWFGSTQFSTFLLRSEQDATVYAVSGSNKYPIASWNVLSALSPLGSVGYVSQQYLDHRTTGKTIQRSILGPDGTVYFFDAGIRLPFGSCGQVADFGMTCGDAVPFDAALVAALHSGPRMTNLYRTTSGKAFYVEAGAKREVADDASLTQADLPTSAVTLLETGVGYLPYGVPVTRDGIILKARDGVTTVLSTGDAFTPLTSGMARTAGISTLPVRSLDGASLRRLAQAAVLTPLAGDTAGSNVYLLTTGGKVKITDAAAVPATPLVVTDGVLSAVPDAGTASYPVFLKSEDDVTVYFLKAGQRRAIRSWAELISLNGGSENPKIFTVGGSATTLLTAGPTQVSPGSLVKSPDNVTVYLADGTGARVTVGSFAVTSELGATRLTTISSADLAQYSLSTGMLSTALNCGTSQYLGLSGRLMPVSPAMATIYRLAFTTLDSSTCAALPRSSQQLDRFLRTSDGTIYYMEDGLKRPIHSYQTYVGAGGTAANTVSISDFTASLFRTGAFY